MEPFKANKLPIQYNMDKELLSLISKVNEKYGEYKSNLKNSKFDSKFFFRFILSESLKSTQIEGAQISQDEMYYLKYIPKLTEKQKQFVYSNEADIINEALFGMTAKEWRDNNPNLEGNIRDYADITLIKVKD